MAARGTGHLGLAGALCALLLQLSLVAACSSSEACDASVLLQVAASASTSGPFDNDDDDPLRLLREQLQRFMGPEGAIERKLLNTTMENVWQQVHNQTSGEVPSVAQAPHPPPPAPAKAPHDGDHPLKLLMDQMQLFRGHGIERNLFNTTMRNIMQQIQTQTKAAPSAIQGLQQVAKDGLTAALRQQQQPKNILSQQQRQNKVPQQEDKLPLRMPTPAPSASQQDPLRALADQFMNMVGPAGAIARHLINTTVQKLQKGAEQGALQAARKPVPMELVRAVPQPSPEEVDHQRVECVSRAERERRMGVLGPEEFRGAVKRCISD